MPSTDGISEELTAEYLWRRETINIILKKIRIYSPPQYV